MSEVLKENCFVFMEHMLGISDGGYVRPDKNYLPNNFDVADRSDAQVLFFVCRRTRKPVHAAVINPDNPDLVDHKAADSRLSGYGKPLSYAKYGYGDGTGAFEFVWAKPKKR